VISNKKARYDSDEEPSEEAMICWRMDPDKSHSDWTIQIVSTLGGEGQPKVDTYHHLPL
jgi:hypothetical protein